MQLPIIRELASKHTVLELERAAEAFESSRENSFNVGGKDEAEILTHLLMAAVVRAKMDGGLSLPDALREHSQSVRSMLTGLKK